MPKEGEIQYVRTIRHSNIFGIPFAIPGFFHMEQYLDGEWRQPPKWEINLWSEKARKRRKGH